MILERTYVQQMTSVVPGNFVTANEFGSLMRSYHGHEFCIIPALDYSVACTVERRTGILHIKATMRGKSLQTFDNKITTRSCARLPLNRVFHFNHDGLVVGVTATGGKPLSLEISTAAILSANLVGVSRLYRKTAGSFIAELVAQVHRTTAIVWQDIQRVGFYIGDSGLKHTNSMALGGIVASVFSQVARLRLKGIHAHAPEYAETIFWFELKQASGEVYTELGENTEELSKEFMGKLDSCL